MSLSRRPQGEEGEFFVQLFMEPDPSLKHPPSISLLLSRMFSEQNIKFSKVVCVLCRCVYAGVCVCVCTCVTSVP